MASSPEEAVRRYRASPKYSDDSIVVWEEDDTNQSMNFRLAIDDVDYFLESFPKKGV